MSKIRECFISRWKEDGYILEADYSQLEVLGLSHLSGDRQLRIDLENGLDMHCLNASFLYNTTYDTIKTAVDNGDKEWSARRKTAKGPGFLIQYGGGANAMALKTGLSKKQCSEFIENYYKRYSGVKKWQQQVAEAVEISKQPTTRITKAGHQVHRGTYRSITGRDYVFYEEDAPDFLVERGVYVSFSPTNMKNYPVQGFATGDIVPLAVGDLYYRFVNDINLIDKSLLINTIHDSVMTDTKKEALDYTAHVLKEVMENVIQSLHDIYGISLSLPLPVDVSYGPNLLDQTKYQFE